MGVRGRNAERRKNYVAVVCEEGCDFGGVCGEEVFGVCGVLCVVGV